MSNRESFKTTKITKYKKEILSLKAIKLKFSGRCAVIIHILKIAEVIYNLATFLSCLVM